MYECEIDRAREMASSGLEGVRVAVAPNGNIRMVYGDATHGWEGVAKWLSTLRPETGIDLEPLHLLRRILGAKVKLRRRETRRKYILGTER